MVVVTVARHQTEDITPVGRLRQARQSIGQGSQAAHRADTPARRPRRARARTRSISTASAPCPPARAVPAHRCAAGSRPPVDGRQALAAAEQCGAKAAGGTNAGAQGWGGAGWAARTHASASTNVPLGTAADHAVVAPVCVRTGGFCHHEGLDKELERGGIPRRHRCGLGAAGVGEAPLSVDGRAVDAEPRFPHLPVDRDDPSKAWVGEPRLDVYGNLGLPPAGW